MKKDLAKKFFGRKKELNHLSWFLKKRAASMIVVRGRRRIGKTRLIQEFAKDHSFYSFTGLAPVEGIGAKEQKDLFKKKLEEYFQISINSDNWVDIFTFLAKMTATGRHIILFDEISWMASYDPTFLPKLKNVWDEHFNKNPKIILFLCGSVSYWIDQNILSSTGFLGRISYTLDLKELPIEEVSEFWGRYKHRYSAYEICKVLSITGGVPLYLENILPEYGAEENIKRLCFEPGGLLVEEFDRIFSDLFSTRSLVYQKIVTSLIDGAKTLEEIGLETDYKPCGSLSNYIHQLEISGFIKRDYTWNIKSQKKSKLSKIRLVDAYLRFYLKYIYPIKERLEGKELLAEGISLKEKWYSIIGLQFETLVLRNRHKILQSLHLTYDDIINDGPYFQRKSVKTSACQIDYLIQTKTNILYICEIKFSKHPIGLGIKEEIEKKINALGAMKRQSYQTVLIHVNGVTEELEDEGYFAHIIDFGEFLKQ